MSTGRSALATQVEDLKSDRPRRGRPYGLCVHTSGSGVLDRAQAQGRHPDDVALDYYDSAAYSTHYLAGHRGYYQITDDCERVQHIGYTDGIGGLMSPAQRRAWYQSGEWRKEMPAAFVQRWETAWPGRSSPSSLHPSKWPNEDYVGIEVIPCREQWGQPFDDCRYSLAQHIVVAICGFELSVRHGWPDGWEDTGRLVGHEDVGPHARVTRGQAWDPGRHRATPWIDWVTIKAWVEICRLHGVAFPIAMARLIGEWEEQEDD